VTKATFALATALLVLAPSLAFAGDGVTLDCKTADGSLTVKVDRFFSSDGDAYSNDFNFRMGAKVLTEKLKVSEFGNDDSFFQDVEVNPAAILIADGKIVATVRFVSTGRTLSVDDHDGCQVKTKRVQNLEVSFGPSQKPNAMKCIEVKDVGHCS
jgi:hypothetical protein